MSNILSFPDLKQVQFWGIVFLYFSLNILSKFSTNGYIILGLGPGASGWDDPIFCNQPSALSPAKKPPRRWHWPRFPLKHRRPFVEDQPKISRLFRFAASFQMASEKKRFKHVQKRGGGNDFFFCGFLFDDVHPIWPNYSISPTWIFLN